MRLANGGYTWSEHQYQMDEMVTPKITPVQGIS